jgi:diguanylate cyclase (GGDEF)-like protein
LRKEFVSKKGNPFPAKTKVDADPLNQWVISRRAPLIVKDLSRDFRFKGLDIAAIEGKCFLISPLLVEGKVTGLVRICSPQPDIFDSEDQRLLESLVSLAGLSLENAKLFAETEKLAITDGLTKLLLRRPLLERLEEELRRSAERKSQLSCILLDIDHFKSVNDTFGHPAGDEVLRAIAAILKHNVRDVDFLGRYGGEEFMVLLPETPLEGSRLVADRIRQAVAARPFRLREQDRTITVSLGVAVYPQAASEMEGLIQKADEALYYAKEHGRNQVVDFTQLGGGSKKGKQG